MVDKNNSKHRITLGYLDQYTCRGLRLWNIWDSEAAQGSLPKNDRDLKLLFTSGPNDDPSMKWTDDELSHRQTSNSKLGKIWFWVKFDLECQDQLPIKTVHWSRCFEALIHIWWSQLVWVTSYHVDKLVIDTQMDTQKTQAATIHKGQNWHQVIKIWYLNTKYRVRHAQGSWKNRTLLTQCHHGRLDWIGFVPPGRISCPIWVEVSHSYFQSMNKLIKPDHIVQVRGLIDFRKLHQFRYDSSEGLCRKSGHSYLT